MERLELKTSSGSRVAIGFLLLIVVLPVMILGGAIGLAIGGVIIAGFIWLCVAMGKRRLVLDERGVTAIGMRGERHLDWDQAHHYMFWSMDQQAVYAAGGQGGAIGVIVVLAIVAIVKAVRKSKNEHRRFAQGRLTLVGADVTIPIDGRYKDVGNALDRVFAELHPRLRARPKNVTDFAPFTVTDTELSHVKKGTLGLADVEKINAGGARITVKKRDKRLAWVNVPMKGVKNVMLFLEIAAEHGLVVNANAEVFMPPTVLDKLRAAAARQSAMPQARVVSR